jgi:hypothetical protein
MVEITPFHDRLVLEVQGWHKVWALKSQLDIPLEHIKGVHADPHPAMGWFQGLKLAGADIPHIFRAGLFYQDGNKVFWDVRHPANTIVIDLEDESYARLIVEVEDSEASVKMILEAIRNYQEAKAAAEAELNRSLEDPIPAVHSVPSLPTQDHTPEVSEQEQEIVQSHSE